MTEKLRGSAFLKKSYNFHTHKCLISSALPTPVSWASSGSLSSVAGTRASSWTAACLTWGGLFLFSNTALLAGNTPWARILLPAFLPLLGGLQLLTLIPSPPASFSLRVPEKRVETKDDGSRKVGGGGLAIKTEEEQDRHTENMWGRGGNEGVREEQGLKKI